MSGISSIVEIEAWRYSFEQLPKQVADCFTHDERRVYELGTVAIINLLLEIGETQIIEACRVFIEDFLFGPKVWFSLSSIELAHTIRLRLPLKSEIPNFIPHRGAQLNSLFD